MIQSILHTGLRDYFLKGKQLPDSLVKHEEGLRYWLSILDAVTEDKDLDLSGCQLIKSKQSYRLLVDGVGEFSFQWTDRNISKLNFKQH